MEANRGERRARTERYGAHARRVHLRQIHPSGVVDCVCERSVWKFAKGKSAGCHCRRSRPGRPKVVQSMCHNADKGSGYHPCVRERIAGKRLAQAWMRTLDRDDCSL